MPKAVKVLVLLSGGLDSRLVCRMLGEQLGRKNVEAVFFALPFGRGCCSDKFCVVRFCQGQGFRLHMIDCTKGRMFRKYMGIIRNPEFQRGAGMNPCIDCHIFMLREARRLARRTGADIIATGEVLGERPLSQNKGALNLIERKAKLEGRLLRPLSAKLLPETLAEKKGWIKRSKMLDIQGRQRKRQMALARKYKISFPSPGGGCLLTEKEFSRRLLALLDLKGDVKLDDIELLRLGRHFRCRKSIIIVGRREEENKRLLKTARKQGIPYMEVKDYMGPVTLVLGRAGGALKAAAGLTVRYSDSPRGRMVELEYRKGKARKSLKAKPILKRELEGLRV